MAPYDPSREAIALLREWIDELETRLAPRPANQNRAAPEEQEDRELAEKWATRYLARERRQRTDRQCQPVARARKMS